MISPSPVVFGLIISMIIICASLITMLSWIRRYEDGNMKKLSLVFIIFIATVAILWLVCVWIVVGLITNKPEDASPGILLFIQIVLVLSVQLLISSFIGDVVVKYRKQYIPFQAVTYASFGYFDFYLTYLLLCVKIDPLAKSGEVFSIRQGISLLGNRWAITFLVLAIAFMIVASAVIRTREVKRIRQNAGVLDGENESVQVVVEEPKNVENKETAQDKLAKLKDLHDKNLITDEEYETKRAEVLKDL
ncbi:MAG: SHOCT domain-containing protein [Clostridia bacterium]|nr:SHOCT domain-containing protein [Clostridia bacterium]